MLVIEPLLFSVLRHTFFKLLQLFLLQQETVLDSVTGTARGLATFGVLVSSLEEASVAEAWPWGVLAHALDSCAGFAVHLSGGACEELLQGLLGDVGVWVELGLENLD